MVQAQTVPAVAADQTQQVAQAQPVTQQPLPPVRLVSPNRVYLDGKEAAGVALANQWKSHPDQPRRGADGSVVYLYGATLPTLVCTPLEVCAIRLQAGEVVNDVHAGDTARWRITPATSGAGANQTTLVIVKPTDAGLTTNLLIATDRRTYSIKLASTQKDWIPMLSFDYPDEVSAAWDAYRQQHAQQVAATTLPSGQNLANLDFGFEIRGDRPRWTPQRVYTDGVKTYIQFPSASFAGSEAPALVSLARAAGLFKKPTQELVNYRVIGDRYVVDQVIERAALISGVGSSQVEVIIERKGH
ncbi:MAG TPA: P-type conjugative transfer protein TrbG [Candidatus Hydrogenedentes bacterium]|nr:P-type conjugative transfer protein TrbG [Candidatus Hydrogenedentota bacterium]